MLPARPSSRSIRDCRADGHGRSTILEDGTTHRGRGEIHAGWVVHGLAIQDVWMTPRLRDRQPNIEPLPGAGNSYGTTLRIDDARLDAW